MNFKKLFLFICLVTFSVFTISCKKEEETKFTPIIDVLNQGKNNDALTISGVVYGVLENGFYVADSEQGKIFVIMGSEWDKNIAAGDKVSVKGQFSYVSNFPQVKNVEKVETLSTGNQTFVPVVASDINTINALDDTLKIGSYGNYYLITGVILKTAAGIYQIADDAGNKLFVNEGSNAAALEEKLNKRVKLTVITHKLSVSDNVWIVSFASSLGSITDDKLTFASIKESALTYVNSVVPKEIYGALELPKAHPTQEYITLVWDAVANEYLTVDQETGLVTVKIDNVDHEITLKLTISDGSESETIDYAITSKAIVERSVSQLFTDIPKIEMSVVIVRGIVVGIARNQSESLRSLIIKDKDGLVTTTVDFGKGGDGLVLNTSEEYKAIECGDEILVTGKFRIASRTTVMDVSSLQVVSKENPYAHDYQNALVLDGSEGYLDLANNYDTYANKLVKFVNPYMNYSTSTTPAATNWVRLGYDANIGDAGHGEGTNIHYFAFLIAAQNENLGGDTWHTMYNIPFYNAGAEQFDVTIYAYAMYVSDTYIAFVIPDWDCYQVSGVDSIGIALSKALPATIESGTVSLLATHELVEGDITWTSSDDTAIDSLTGKVTEVEESVEVTLTAKFKYQGVDYVREYKVTVLKAEAMTVTEVLDSGTDSQVVKVSGVIAGYVSDGNKSGTLRGIILMDEFTHQTILVDGMEAVGPSVHGEYHATNGDLLVVGDNIVISGAVFVVGGTRQSVLVSAESKIKVLSQNNDIVWDVDNAITISTHEQLQDFTNNLQFGKLIKIVGTTENPICIGGSSSKLPFNIKIFLNKDTVDNDGTKYNGKTFALKTDINDLNGGSDWWKTMFGFTGPFVGPKDPVLPFNFTGTLYVVLAAETGTYYQLAIVNISATSLTPIE